MIKEEDLRKIEGGKVSATMINSISRIATIVLEIGRTLGSVVRRTVTKSLC